MNYIRRTYGIDLKVRDRVVVKRNVGCIAEGRTGTILRSHGPYLVVRGDGWRGNFHPADIEKVEDSPTNG